MKTIAIPLGRLQLAETNMRTSHRSAGLEELKASLLVHGQLQPIVVTPAADGAGFAVVAGARRTLAARALVAEGKWPDTARLAAVRRRAGEAEARELSLAENLQRVAPCAADEALAFARLVRDGADPAALAARFGRPVRYVRQRLALAALSPAVLEALREGRVALAVAEALTLSASHARQEELLERVLDCPPADAARYVREALRRVLLPAGHALPGVLDAYAGAGGHADPRPVRRRRRRPGRQPGAVPRLPAGGARGRGRAAAGRLGLRRGAGRPPGLELARGLQPRRAEPDAGAAGAPRRP